MELERAAALADERLASFRAEFDVPGIAYGLVKDWDKVAVIDSENHSADL